MNISAKVQDQWKAPAGDGQLLIWPADRGLLDSIHENRKVLGSADSVRIANVPLPELRRTHRAWLGHSNVSQPLIAMGHQLELYHPGVWAKNVLIHELAAATGGEAYHLVIDTDAPKHLTLRWPEESWPITDDPHLMTAPWAGLLGSPTPRHLGLIGAAIDSASRSWSFRPLLPAVISSLRRLTLETPQLTASLSNAIHAVEWQLGLRHHALPATPIWQSREYLVFVHHILANAESFARVYNAALGAYRSGNAIRHPGRPWPDLRVTADEVEVPFWVDSLDREQRRRGHVIRSAGAFAIRADGGDILPLDAAREGHAAAERLGRFLSGKSLLLSPRALTLTCFLRLFMADQFVHGIGGARYDAVTDRVIADWFGLRPPAFAVTTATLLFPGALEAEPVDLQALAREGRHLRHGSDLPRKRELVKRIESLPRRSAERSRVYYEMHSLLGELLHGEHFRQWQRRFEQAKAAARRQEELRDRELFFALQPEDRLRMVISQYHDAVTRAAGPRGALQ